MNKILTLCFLLAYSASTLACTFNISLYDEYGDGWNDNFLTVQVNGSDVLTNITLLNGSGPEVYTFTANSGDILTFIFDATGSWTSEPYYTVINDLGNQIFSDGMNYTVPAGGTFPADCSPPPPPPPNDVPCGAVSLTVNPTCNYSTYTTQSALPSAVPAPSCGWNYLGGDIWFSATVPVEGLSVSLQAGTMTQAGIAIYTGPNCNTLTQYLCSENTGGMPPVQTVSGTAGLTGQTVWIRIWDPMNDGQGTIDICTYFPPPPPSNNDPCTSISLTVNPSCNYSTFTTLNASGSAIPAPSCGWSYTGGDIWFSAVVPADGVAFQLQANQMTDGGIAIYTGPNCSNLTEIACNESTWSMPAQVSVGSILGLTGQTVWVRVWDPNSDNQGLVDICAFVPPPTIQVTSTTYTPTQLVEDILVTGCLQANNVIYNGDPYAIGYFTGGNLIGFESGIIISTGYAENANGVYVGNVDWCGDWSANGPCSGSVANDLFFIADSTLQAVGGGSSINSINDLAILEFDFVPSSDSTEFRFVFASSEYNAFECTSYNDIFAFFISGPGITGNPNYSGNQQNIAIIPGTNTPITISTVNGDPSCGPDNSAFYVNYLGPDFEFDGFTVPLTAAMYGLIPCQTYHIKFAIADAGDQSLSSAVFFEAASFSSGGDVIMSSYSDVGTIDDLYEGCQNYYVFQRIDTTDLSDSLEIQLQISGTAILGTDITDIPTTLWIPPGEIYDTLFYSAFQDDLVEGTEFVVFALENGCPCSMSTSNDTIAIFDMVDLNPVNVTGDSLICLGGSVTLTANVNPLANPAFISYLWNTNETTNSITVTPNTTTTYSVNISDPCVHDTLLFHTITVIPQIDVSFSTSSDSICANEYATILFTGSAGASAIFIWDFDGGTVLSGSGSGPYQVSWSSQGDYVISLTINDNGCLNDSSISIHVSQIPTSDFSYTPTIICAGDHLSFLYTGNANPAATYIWNFNGGTINSGTGQGPIDVNWASEGDKNISLQVKENGCPSTYTQITIYNPSAFSISLVTSDITCPNGSQGQATVTPSGGVPDYSYSWFPGDGTSFPQGTHYVTVTDDLGCTDTMSFYISEPDQFVYSASYSDVKCFGGSNGSVSTNLSGGSPPYIYSWKKDNNPLAASSASLNGLSIGTYTVLITDTSGCVVKDTIVVNQPDLLEVFLTDSNNISCYGNTDGFISVTVSGGVPAYSFLWNDSASQISPTASSLSAGFYQVTVQDANLCVQGLSLTLTQPAPFAVSIAGTDATCFGKSNGTITVTPQGGTFPYFYQWTPQQVNSGFIFGLDIGSYAVIITDVNGCQTIASRIINEPAEIFYNTFLKNASCYGFADGKASVSIISGGTSPFDFTWSTGQQNTNTTSSTLVTGAGLYNVSVEDAQSCSFTKSFSIMQPSHIIIGVTSTLKICIGDTTNLFVSALGGNPGYTYHWNSGEIGPFVSVHPIKTTGYVVYATDTIGCSSTAKYIKVAVFDSLKTSLSTSDTAVCEGLPIALSIQTSGGKPPYTYTINEEVVLANSIQYPTAALTTYELTVKDACSTPVVKDESNIIVYPMPPISTSVDKRSCCLGEPLTIRESSPLLGQTYYWELGDDLMGTSDAKEFSYTYQEVGVFYISLTVTSTEGCTSHIMQEQPVVIHPNPVARFTCSPNVVQIVDPQVYFTNLSSEADTSYWFFGDGTDTVKADNPVHQYLSSGTFYPELRVQTRYNCTDETVGQMLIVQDAYTFYAPTGFLPDGDATENKTFSPKMYGFDSENDSYIMIVFDRWGEKVFESSDPLQGWNGKLKDRRLAPVGVYKWYVKYSIGPKGNKVTHEESGSVTLIR